MTVYFDSSALAKLLLDEDGRDLVDDLWRRATSRIFCRLAYPEVRAAVAAAARAKRINRDRVDGLVDDLDELQAAAYVIDVDEVIAIEAGDLADEYALRGYDAVHLACALSIDSPRVVVATWDRDLSAAAGACGCAVAPARP